MKRQSRSGSGVDSSPSKKRCNNSPPTKHSKACKTGASPHAKSQGQERHTPSSPCAGTRSAQDAADAVLATGVADAGADTSAQEGQRPADSPHSREAEVLQRSRAGIDSSGFVEDDVQRELEDANNAAEELLRVCICFLRMLPVWLV